VKRAKPSAITGRGSSISIRYEPLVRELLRGLLWHRAFDNDEVLVLHGRSLGRAAQVGGFGHRKQAT
jgi:hypothetical protein